MKKRLSDVLKIEEIIEAENNRLCIVSGVGSGKNYYVENILKNYGNILYISSRRAKVDEILVNDKCSTTAHWGQAVNDITVLTNAQVEYVVKNTRFDKPFPDIIEHYDFIVVDEAHSLFADATYTNVFHVQTFIDYVADKYPDKKIILMTATPEPIPDNYLFKYKIIDKTEGCINVLPSRIELITEKQAIKLIQCMDRDEKTVYWGNFAGRLVKGKKSLFKQLTENCVFSENDISFCMSSTSATKYQTEYAGLVAHVKKVRSFICENNKLPENTRILLTTATLKEGINIEYGDKNTVIKIAFCESHLLSDIQQFAGRIRDGLETLYIIDDAIQHNVSDEKLRKRHLDFHYCETSLLNSLNSYYHNQIRDTDSEVYNKIGFDEGHVFFHDMFYSDDFSLYFFGNEAIKYFVDSTEKKNDYIRYNHLEHKFELYRSRFDEQRRVNTKLRDNTWLAEIESFADRNGIEFVSKKYEVITLLEPLLGQLIFDSNEKKRIKADLCTILNLNINAHLTTINKVIATYGCDYELVSDTKTINGKSERYLMVNRTSPERQPIKPKAKKKKMLDSKELKYYIYANDKIPFILEGLGHGSIKYHAEKGYYSCANIDGDNLTAINIFNNEGLNVRNWTRPNEFKKADIITLVEYDKQCDFNGAMKYLHSILDLSKIDISELDFSGMGTNSPFVEEDFEDVSAQNLIPIDENILNLCVPLLYIDWYRQGIMPWTRDKFDLRYSYDNKCVVIPIRKWDDGSLVALNMRTTREDYELFGIPKYRLSKDYKKAQNIYGLWENRASIEERGYIVIFEAEKSTLLRDSMNDPTGVSIHGKSLSDAQAEIILSLNIDEAIIALDKDVHIDEVRFMAEKFYKKKKVSYILDSFCLLGEKDSPADCGNKVYQFLFDNRVLYDKAEHEKYLESLAKR